MSILGAIAGIGGSIVDSIFGNSAAEKQADLQKEFAKNGVRWKVEDAKRAGIHPLYALGAQTTAYSPVSVGSTDFATGGQNLGSAIQAMTTPKEKIDGFQKTVQSLTLQKMGLENEVLASQLRMINQPGRGPGMPSSRMIDGQGNSPATMSAADGSLVINVNPKNTPAQTVSDQYGDAAGDGVGILNAIDDMMKTQGTPYPDQVPQVVYEYLKRNGWIPSMQPKRSAARNPRGYGGY